MIDVSTSKVSTGTELARTAGTTMQDVIEAVNRVTRIMGEVSTASVEQSSGIGQVNQAITEMDEVTQQNAALVDQATRAASALELNVRKFRRALDVFKFNQGTSAAAAAPAKVRETQAKSKMREAA